MSEHKHSVYRDIYDDITAKIKNGSYPVGSLLEPERKLMTLYGVERTTVRRALTLLAEEGKIIKKPGVGNFIADPAVSVPTTEQAASAPTPKAAPARTENPSLSPVTATARNDYPAAARLLLEKLAALGHTAAALIASNAAVFSAFAGEALCSGTYDPASFVLIDSPYDAPRAFDRLRRETRGSFPGALVTASPAEAEQILARAESLGIRVPEELSIFCMETDAASGFAGCLFDKLPAAPLYTAMSKPLSLTLLAVPRYSDGKTAAPAQNAGRRGRSMSDYLL